VEAPALNQSGYRLGHDGLLHEDAVTVRTERIFAAEVVGSSAFITMMTTIVNADPRNYDVLVGSVFSD
jgi:translation elongation factor EF-4